MAKKLRARLGAEEAEEDLAKTFEDAVRSAFVAVYGPPRDPATVERSILSSYLSKGRKLGWTDPDPRVVLVLTEFAWVPDSFDSTADMKKWEKATDLLRSWGFKGAWFDSINPAVQIVFHEK